MSRSGGSLTSVSLICQRFTEASIGEVSDPATCPLFPSTRVRPHFGRSSFLDSQQGGEKNRMALRRPLTSLTSLTTARKVGKTAIFRALRLRKEQMTDPIVGRERKIFSAVPMGLMTTKERVGGSRTLPWR
jgi:hypothetical protein